MKINLRSVAVLAICMLISIPPANAWNAIGHMAVAYSAWQQLTPATRKRAVARLKKNPYYKKGWKGLIPARTSTDEQHLYNLIIAATWPEEIKANNSGYK